MVAASSSGSTSAVMRFNSPIASTFSSHRSSSLAFGPGAARLAAAGFCAGALSVPAPIGTLMSMTTSPSAPAPSIDRQFCVLDHLAPLRLLLADELGEVVGRALDRLEEIGREEFFLERGVGEHALHVRIDLGDDGGRRAAR